MVDYLSVTRQGVTIEEIPQTLISKLDKIVNQDGEVKKYCGQLQGRFECGMYVSISRCTTMPYMWNIDVKQSIHKFWYGNNWGDFMFEDFVLSIRCLMGLFNMEPNQFTIKTFEFGVNIKLGFVHNYHNSFIAYQPNRINLFQNIGFDNFQRSKLEGKKAIGDDYILKCYFKSQQYPTISEAKNIVRFEIRVKKNRFLNRRGICVRSLSDLLDRGVMVKLKRLLVQMFSCVIRERPVNGTALSNRQIRTLENGFTTDWGKLRKRVKPSTFTKRWNTFKRLNDLSDNGYIDRRVLDAITSKMDYLLYSNSQQQQQQQQQAVKLYTYAPP